VLTAPRNWQHPSVYAIHAPQGRCHGLRQRRTSVYTPLARHGRVTHAAAHRRTSTDLAPTAVCDRRGAHLLRDRVFLAGRVAHAAAHRRPLTDVAPTDVAPISVAHAAAHRRSLTDVAPTDVAPTAVCDCRGAHLLRGHFFLASRVAHASAHRIPLTVVSPTDECHCRRTHLLRAPLVSGQCVAGKQWRTRWVVMSLSWPPYWEPEHALEYAVRCWSTFKAVCASVWEGLGAAADPIGGVTLTWVRTPSYVTTLVWTGSRLFTVRMLLRSASGCRGLF